MAKREDVRVGSVVRVVGCATGLEYKGLVTECYPRFAVVVYKSSLNPKNELLQVTESIFYEDILRVEKY